MANFHHVKAVFDGELYETVYSFPFEMILKGKQQLFLCVSKNLIGGKIVWEGNKLFPFNLADEEIGQLYGGN